MKKIAPLIAFVIFACSLSAQNASGSFSRQFGFDALDLVSRVFNSSAGQNPYDITYRRFGDNRNTRLGLGADFSVEGNGFGAGGSSSVIDLHFRAGSERYNDFGNRWRAFYGWDFKTFFTFHSSANGISATRLGLGAAPVFGLQWRLNERLSLATEIAYDLFLTLQENDGRTRFGAFTAFRPPFALYAQYDF